MSTSTNTLTLPLGIGKQTAEKALAGLSDLTTEITPIQPDEYCARLEKAQTYMRNNNIDALYLNAGSSLYYFTGLRWYPSERMVGAIIPANGDFCYIAPSFEKGSIEDFWLLHGAIYTWQEHESPYALLAKVLVQAKLNETCVLAIDESTPFFHVNGIQTAAPAITLVNADAVTAHCRMHKSVNEIALIQRAMDMTLTVHIATASMLTAGITTTEVEAFINRAHQAVGSAGSSFCIVLFGAATAFPHGVKEPQILKEGDTVLIDTGCRLQGYNSDITRTYVFGEPSAIQQEMWLHEKAAQQAAFEAAYIGATCGDVDAAVREYFQSVGLGPEYQLPGCPHRTGHGLGLDIHEWPYLVKDNPQALAKGMCFSNEPMLVVPDNFGIRLEDHFYMTDDKAKWFTQPSHSLDDPFGLAL
jgi:Xaa-Pro dipeptidase